MITQNWLVEEAEKARNFSYSPYSKYRVGAALLTKSGEVIRGSNIENVSYGLTVCAERVAIFKAISEGYNKFLAIAIATSSGEPAFSCGACRQVLMEFAPDITIYLQNSKKAYTLKELLPNAFSPQDLEKNTNGK